MRQSATQTSGHSLNPQSSPQSDNKLARQAAPRSGTVLTVAGQPRLIDWAQWWALYAEQPELELEVV